jgi:hypothetical protein
VAPPSAENTTTPPRLFVAAATQVFTDEHDTELTEVRPFGVVTTDHEATPLAEKAPTTGWEAAFVIPSATQRAELGQDKPSRYTIALGRTRGGDQDPPASEVNETDGWACRPGSAITHSALSEHDTILVPYRPVGGDPSVHVVPVF